MSSVLERVDPERLHARPILRFVPRPHDRIGHEREPRFELGREHLERHDAGVAIGARCELRSEIVDGLRERERVAISGALVEHVGGGERETALLGRLDRASVGNDDRNGRERKVVALPVRLQAAHETAQKTFVEGKLGEDLPSIDVPKSELEAGIAAFDLFRRATKRKLKPNQQSSVRDLTHRVERKPLKQRHW